MLSGSAAIAPAQRAVEQAGGVGCALVAALEVGSGDGVGEERVAADQRVPRDLDADHVARVAREARRPAPSGRRWRGDLHRRRARPARRSARRERVPRGRGGAWRRASGELARAGEVVGVDVGVEHAGDAGTASRGLVQVRPDVRGGVDDERLVPGEQQVGKAAACLAAELHDPDRTVRAGSRRVAGRVTSRSGPRARCAPRSERARVRRLRAATRCRRCR